MGVDSYLNNSLEPSLKPSSLFNIGGGLSLSLFEDSLPTSCTLTLMITRATASFPFTQTTGQGPGYVARWKILHYNICHLIAYANNAYMKIMSSLLLWSGELPMLD